jgi:hypothetical protein
MHSELLEKIAEELVKRETCGRNHEPGKRRPNDVMPGDVEDAGMLRWHVVDDTSPISTYQWDAGVPGLLHYEDRLTAISSFDRGLASLGYGRGPAIGVAIVVVNNAASGYVKALQYAARGRPRRPSPDGPRHAAVTIER